VRAAIDVYKAIRPQIARAVPHWPLGLPGWTDGWVACALEADDTALLAVWRRHGAPPRVTLELPWWPGGEPAVELLHPADLPCVWTWDAPARRLAVHLPETPSARLLRLTHGTTTTRRSDTHA
jgi:alpha-galactosidase